MRRRDPARERPAGAPRRYLGRGLLAALLLAAPAAALGQEPLDDGGPEEAPEASVLDVPPDPGPALTSTGYVDVGFVDAQGDGTSFAPGDRRLPADYGVDPFAPAVNSLGEAASTDPGGRFTNGFLPRSAGVGGRPSPMINTVSADLRYVAPGAPVMIYGRAHLLPRFFDRTGARTRLWVEQAFGRISPFDTHELALSVGKFDSVFGIEYLENQASLRTGVTPSLLARYTTGQGLGAKLFYRRQLAPLWSAVSLNVAATTAAPFVEALQPPDRSLTGRPVLSARLGYDLNLPRLQVRLGGSAMRGPRNDQGSPRAGQQALGGDLRISVFGLSLSGEYVHVDQEDGPAHDKRTGLGPQTVASAFHARGAYATLAWALPWAGGALRRATLYTRLERRHAWFEGFAPITVARATAGARLDLWDTLALKAEGLLNRELAGAPTVDNDVFVASAVWMW
jgi:hypothetical protein